jgi:hypothetical protein
VPPATGGGIALLRTALVRYPLVLLVRQPSMISSQGSLPGALHVIEGAAMIWFVLLHLVEFVVDLLTCADTAGEVPAAWSAMPSTS